MAVPSDCSAMKLSSWSGVRAGRPAAAALDGNNGAVEKLTSKAPPAWSR